MIVRIKYVQIWLQKMTGNCWLQLDIPVATHYLQSLNVIYRHISQMSDQRPPVNPRMKFLVLTEKSSRCLKCYCNPWELSNGLPYANLLLRLNMSQFRINTRWGITSVSFSLTYHFPDLHHIHENSTEPLGRKYSIVNLLKNIKTWSFLCQYHSLVQRWTLLLKSHVFGIIRKLDVSQYIFTYTFNQTSAMTCELFSQSLFLKSLSLYWKI